MNYIFHILFLFSFIVLTSEAFLLTDHYKKKKKEEARVEMFYLNVFVFKKKLFKNELKVS
jgi:hypothetical protein